MIKYLFLTLVNTNAFLLNNNVLRSLSGPNGPVIKMLQPSDIIEKINTKQIGVPDSWSYNELFEHQKTIESAVIVGNQNAGLFYDDSSFHIYKYLPNMVDDLLKFLQVNKIDYQIYDVPLPSTFQVPFFVQMIGIYFLISFILNRFSLGPGNMNGNPFNNLNKKDNMIEQGQVQTRFEDVAGLDEAKEELEEIVDYLKNPLKYIFSGAKIPTGVLLEGPPGTGKTLLARAVAGEAGVSFMSASGSEFIEMFVGVGAQRVRSLFNEASKNKPCVIFIDEIDAVGGKRGSGFNSGGNDEREQTLNQILTNMDGFDKSDGIIVLAATNRADTLDPALKRSGRFDRKITVSLPDIIGRQEIAKVHFRNKANVTIDYENLAKLTQGFSGADIETLANEAALLKVRNNLTVIDDSLVLRSFEKMTIGLPKKYDIRSDETKTLVACHEIGHALMVKYFSEYFKLQRVTMNANTNGAGGYTLFTPNNFYAEYPTKGFYLAQIIVALGGRAAEIVYFERNSKTNYTVFNNYNDIDISTGASNDLRQANYLCERYLELFENYLNPDSISDLTRTDINKKISVLIKKSLDTSIEIIKQNITNFDILTNKLINENTINL